MTGTIELFRLRPVFDDQQLVASLQRYFAVDASPDQVPAYTGGWFERLGGGGDRPETANHITADDLVAVEMLSVQIPAPVSWNLLEGPLGEKINTLLAQVPVRLELVDDAAEQQITNTSPAWAAWTLLKEQSGVSWVKAGKLVARKRPHLLPVYDDVVRCALGSPANFWSSMRALLRAEDRAFQGRLEDVRAAAGLEGISVLRVFDVAVWLSHQDSHRRECKAARSSSGLATSYPELSTSDQEDSPGVQG